MTMTLASLASDTNLVAGRQSTVVDQKDTDDAIDCIIGGLVTTGTSPTNNRQIGIFLFGSYDDTNFSGAAGGTDANLTAVSTSLFKFLLWIPTNNTSNRAHNWGPFSVAQAFGGIIPPQWGVWIVHNTGVALNSTSGNHELVYTTVKYESA